MNEEYLMKNICSYSKYVKILNEGVSSFKYKFPYDKEAQLFDFYTLVSLPIWGLSGSDTKAEYRDSDQLLAAAKEAQLTVVKALRDQQLKDVLFSIAAEFRHVFDHNSAERIIDFAKKNGMEDFVKKYAMVYKLRSTNSKEYITRLEKIRTEYDANDNRGYLESYKAMLATKKNSKDVVEFIGKCFIGLQWASYYGGKPWENICRAWLKLEAATKYDDQTVWIDHVFDLQHNTDTVFNKIKAYSKIGGYSWIKQALDKKRNAKSLYDFWNDMSGDLRYFTARVVKAATGESYEAWAKANTVGVTKQTAAKSLYRKKSDHSLGGLLPSDFDDNKLPSTQQDSQTGGGSIIWYNDTWENGTWTGGIWYNGIWEKGTWENGIWENGTWEKGTWKDGTWKGGIWKNGTWEKGGWGKGKWLNGTWESGTWENGYWFHGTWQNGVWYKGIWFNGTWENGYWFHGTWSGGKWMTGEHHGGTWVKGIWEDGTWIDGIWKDGTWEKGTWEKGTWEKGTWKDGRWKGGTWKSGTWKTGWIYDPKKEGNILPEYKIMGDYVKSPIPPDLYWAK